MNIELHQTIQVATARSMDLTPAKILEVFKPTKKTPVWKCRVRVLHNGMEITVKYQHGSSQWHQIN